MVNVVMFGIKYNHFLGGALIVKLIIGNKKYSSWSMRPWLILKVKGIKFDEELSVLNFATNNRHFSDFSPSKKVPVLKHDGMTVWDSLAIMEYVSELFPEKQLWPDDLRARAHARSIANEMHSGFLAIRNEFPMNMCRKPNVVNPSPAALDDINRVEKIWAECLDMYDGPYLFGDFSISDAMFAPVVNRLQVYKVQCQPSTIRYCDVITELKAWKEWDRAAHKEPWIYENAEI